MLKKSNNQIWFRTQIHEKTNVQEEAEARKNKGRADKASKGGWIESQHERKFQRQSLYQKWSSMIIALPSGLQRVVKKGDGPCSQGYSSWSIALVGTRVA